MSFVDIPVIDIPDFANVDDFAEAWQSLRPRATVSFAHWNILNMQNDEGRTYDVRSFPHVVAPGGPTDSFDDTNIRTITLQWATRLGKTHFGECMVHFIAHTRPAPMMLASEAQERTEGIIARLYKQMYLAEHLHSELLWKLKSQHHSRRIEFENCMLHGAWAKSPGSLADRNICFGWGNEIDKQGWFQVSTSKEAPPIKLFEERFKDFQSVRKVLFESTPTVQGESEVERRRLSGTNCQYYVPCPHCRRYQVLRIGARDENNKIMVDAPGRLDFEATDGKIDRNLAFNTAQYICVSGKCEPINNHHRSEMMRYGVWVPQGCEINHKEAWKAAERRQQELDDVLGQRKRVRYFKWTGWKDAKWVEGTPDHDSQHASYGPLPSLVALSLSWGDVAAEFVDSVRDPKRMQNFINSWLGETWTTATRRQSWEQLFERVITDCKRDVVPLGYSLVTVAFDKQEIEPCYPFMIVAWNWDWSPRVLDYGYLDTLEQCERVLTRRYPHEDGGQGILVARALFDSGYLPKDVAPFCRHMGKTHKLPVMMCKGSSTDLNCNFKVRRLGKDSETPGMRLVLVDTLRSQEWAESVIHELHQEDAGGLGVFEGEKDDHWDLCEQLLNQAQDPIKKNWDKVHADTPDDLRDVLRYNWIAARLHQRGGAIPERTNTPAAAKETNRKKKNSAKSPMDYLDRAGGWI